MKKLITPTIGLWMLAIFSVIPIIFNIATTGNIRGAFLFWNLFLAWLPLPMARGFARTFSLTPGPKMALSIMFFFAWLFFFPNAPYIITDLIHLQGAHDPNYWLEATVLFSFALTGLLAGAYSMYILHRKLEEVTGSLFAWLTIVVCSFLSGFGIYLGRVQRWNTWDILTSPQTLLKASYRALQNELALEMTLGFGLLIIISYFMVLSFMRYERHV